MQSVSADLSAAILARQRQPKVRLRCDWDDDGSFTTVGSGYQDDISADVVSVDTNMEFATDIPAQAKLFTGSAAAQATITLAHRDPAGDPTHHGGWFYSPLNSASPLFSKQRKGRAVTLEFGFVTAAGTAEYVTVLVGTIRSLTVSAGGRQATMVVADRSETMRKQVQLPAIIANGAIANLIGAAVIKPGLNTTFLADWVARACGYYASPPARSDCRMLATHHGSGWPEVGALQHHHGHTGGQIAYAPTTSFGQAAKWVQAAGMNGDSGQEVTYILGGGGALTTNNGGELLWEGWRLFNTVAVDQPLFILYKTGTGDPYVTAFWQASTGRITVIYSRSVGDGDHASAAGPVVSPGTANWHYYGIQVGFNSSTVDITYRYDSTTTGPESIATTSTVGAPALDTVGLARGYVSALAPGYSNAWIEADQVTGESSTTDWNNAFTPTAQIVPSSAVDNRLVATPNVTENGWPLLQQIAESEFATAGFTETGMLFYWSRARWTTAPYTTSQRTLTAAAALKELATVEAADQIRNRVVIRSRTPTINALETVWKLAEAWTISASSSITKLVETEDPIGNVDTAVAYGVAPGSSRYLAGDRLDGQGNQVSNLTIGIVVLGPTTLRVTIDNALNAKTVYMVGDENASATYSGVPYLWIDAQKILFSEESGTRVEASDSTSISDYGEQLLEIPDSDLRQNDDDLQQLADDLKGDLADPGPAMTDVPAVGDPRIQLGDRLTIVDPDGLVMSEDFHASAVNFSYSSGGLEMTLSLRKA